LAIDPSVTTVAAGDVFSVNVNVTDVANLTAWQLHIYYLKALINCTGVAEGNFLKSGGETYFGHNITNNYNSTHGRILAYCTLLGMNSVSGDGVLLNVTFKALSRGRTDLHLVNTQLGDEEVPPQPIPHLDFGGTVIIAGTGHDVAVTNITPYRTVVGRGYIGNVSLGCNISVAIANQGGYAETFNVTVSVNTTVIAVIVNVNLEAGDLVVRIVAWNTTSFSYGNYTLQAVADVVPGEIDTANNMYVDGTVTVTMLGDINGDGTVDIFDAIVLAGAFGSTPSSPNWIPVADLNYDGTVDIFDAIILAGHYGKST
jgi:hypothetical protein